MKREITFSWLNGQPDLSFEEDKQSVNCQSTDGWCELIEFIAFHSEISTQPVKENKRILTYINGLEKSAENSFFKTVANLGSCIYLYE